MNFVVASCIALLSGLTLIAVRLFQQDHFYSAALLIAAIGASGLFVSLGMYMKQENES